MREADNQIVVMAGSGRGGGRITRPLEMALRLGWYIAKNKLTRHKRFPLVTMLEPLEKWNLACEGWGEIE